MSCFSAFMTSGVSSTTSGIESNSLDKNTGHAVGVVAGHMNGRNGVTLDRREQDPAQRVAHRYPVAALERVGHKTPEAAVDLVVLEGDALGTLQPLQQTLTWHKTSLRVQLDNELFVDASQVDDIAALRYGPNVPGEGIGIDLQPGHHAGP